MSNTKTAGIIIIGNEILSGKLHEGNSFFLASELRELGVSVRRIAVIPDEIKLIGREAYEFSKTYDYVFTSGGVGPTHDDVTMAGIAHGFGVKLIPHPELESFLTKKYKDILTGAMLKIAQVPEGTEVISFKEMRFPVVVFKNIFIFPGIPDYLKNKFSLIKERFRSSPFYLKRIFLNHTHESLIADTLTGIALENKDVDIGSYPIENNPEHCIIITVESKSEGAFKKTLAALKAKLPENIIVRVE